MESLFMMVMYKSQFWKIDFYDWFCGMPAENYHIFYQVILKVVVLILHL